MGDRDIEMPDSANARLIVVPRAIYANIHQGDLPAPLEMNPLYGGHILYTSGTAEIYKRLLWNSRDEERRATAESDNSSV